MFFSHLNTGMLEGWHQTPETAIDLKDAYTRANDRALNTLRKSLEKSIKIYIKQGEDDQITQGVLGEVRHFMVETMGISQWATDQLFDEGYMACSKAFVDQAKATAPHLSTEGIFQALRNVWTMNSLQIYMGEPITYTQAMFAYSMLYPLTDNYLDDVSKSKTDKLTFNERFKSKIETGKTLANDQEEALIFDMIDSIEDQYPRCDYPKVYEALLAILEGQNQSLDQQTVKQLDPDHLLAITFYKGGSSVLADAYLVKGNLSDDQAQFAYYYGVLLQLADDLQDMVTDKAVGHQTLFNQNLNRDTLDPLIYKYMAFAATFYDKVFIEKGPKQEALKTIMQTSLNLLILTALLHHKKHITRPLYKKAKNANTFSLRAYQKFENHMLKHLKTLTPPPT